MPAKSLPAKREILAAICEHVRRELDAAVISQKETQSGATHEESRPENDKDTRALESTYLARGLAQRVGELTEVLGRLHHFQPPGRGVDPVVQAGSLVIAQDHATGRETLIFLAPLGGGIRVSVGGVEVSVVSADSPFGEALLDREIGDEAEVESPHGARIWEILEIA